MTDRISLILRTKNINASQFADEIGVQRSSISHVLSGRNKPSLEFVQRILKRYPEINPDWLLFGKGAMHQESNLFSDIDESIDVKAEAISRALGRSERAISPLVSKSRPRPLKPIYKEEVVPELEETEDFAEDELQPESIQTPIVQLSAQIQASTPVQERLATATPVITVAEAVPAAPQAQEKREAVLPPSSSKEIEKIVVMYKDRSFREYSPE